MGVFSVTVEIGDAAGIRFEPVEALVDAQVTNSVLPREMLQRLGVKPYAKFVYRLADSRRLELEVGRTWVRWDGRQEFTQVVFGPEGSEPILGAITLEEMGLAVDPVSKQLYQVDKYLM